MIRESASRSSEGDVGCVNLFSRKMGRRRKGCPHCIFPNCCCRLDNGRERKIKKRNAGDKCTPQQQQSQLLRGAGIQPGTTHIWQNNTACLALHKRKIERTQFIFEKVTCLPEYPMSPDVMDSLYRIFFSGPAKLRLGLTTPTFVYLRVQRELQTNAQKFAAKSVMLRAKNSDSHYRFVGKHSFLYLAQWDNDL